MDAWREALAAIAGLAMFAAAIVYWVASDRDYRRRDPAGYRAYMASRRARMLAQESGRSQVPTAWRDGREHVTCTVCRALVPLLTEVHYSCLQCADRGVDFRMCAACEETGAHEHQIIAKYRAPHST